MSKDEQKLKFEVAPIFTTIFFVSILLLTWFIIRLVNSTKEKIVSEMEIEMARLERSFSEKADQTFSIITNIITQISQNPQDKNHINKILSDYRNNQILTGAFSWTVFSWSNEDYQIIVDSKYGVMKEPFDLSTRDYLPLTELEPNKFHLGTPVIGSTSKKWMIPGGVGLADKNGKYIGAITMGFEIPVMAQLLYKVIQNPDVNFMLFSKSGNPVLEGNFKSYGPVAIDEASSYSLEIEKIINKINSGSNKKIYNISLFGKRQAFLAKKINGYPYIFILSYDKEAITKELLYVAFTRLNEIFSILFALLILLLLIYRERQQAKHIFELKKEAEIANSTKTEFLIKTTHEFKNFVFGIHGCAEIIKNDLRRMLDNMRKEQDPKNHHHMSELEADLELSRNIIQASNDIDNFLNHLLVINHSKDSDFNIKRSPHPINIAQIIELSITSLKKRAKISEVILLKKISKDLHKISNLDPRRIKQIITSLIAIAIKNSKVGDVVQISAHNIHDPKILENIYNTHGLKKSKAIEITIKDHGPASGEHEMMHILRSTKHSKKDDISSQTKIPAIKYLIEKQGGIFEIKSLKNHGSEIKIIL